MDIFQNNFVPPNYSHPWDNWNTVYQDRGPSTTTHQNMPIFSIGKSNDAVNIAPYCSVCGDNATGKHYGAAACDGCKGFFRRCIRKNQKFVCRSKTGCVVDKEKRNSCRQCRLQKCYAVGMKSESVQSERDKISRRKSNENQDFPNGNSFTALLNAEMVFRYSETTPNTIELNLDLPESKMADIQDVCDLIKKQIQLLNNWSTEIAAIFNISEDDRINLLRAHAGRNLLLQLSRRSVYSTDKLVLPNNLILLKEGNEYWEASGFDMDKIITRVTDELVKSFLDIGMDDKEFTCLRAITFLDPNAKNLQGKEAVRKHRREITTYLETCINAKQHDMETRGRFAEILSTISPLQSISEQMIASIRYAVTFGNLKIDELLQNIFLDDDIE